MTLNEALTDIGVTIRYDGRDLLVIGHDGPDYLALDPGQLRIRTVDPHNASSTISKVEMTEVVRTLTTALTAAQGGLQDAERALSAQQQLVRDIREYAIERHRAGDICREGLDQAFVHFELHPYMPRHSIAVTIVANIGINATSEEEALDRVRFLIDGIAYSGDNHDDDIEVALDSVQTQVAFV